MIHRVIQEIGRDEQQPAEYETVVLTTSPRQSDANPLPARFYHTAAGAGHRPDITVSALSSSCCLSQSSTYRQRGLGVLFPFNSLVRFQHFRSSYLYTKLVPCIVHSTFTIYSSKEESVIR